MKPVTRMVMCELLKLLDYTYLNKLLRIVPEKTSGRTFLTKNSSEKMISDVIKNLERPKNSRKILEFIQKGNFDELLSSKVVFSKSFETYKQFLKLVKNGELINLKETLIYIIGKGEKYAENFFNNDLENVRNFICEMNVPNNNPKEKLNANILVEHPIQTDALKLSNELNKKLEKEIEVKNKKIKKLEKEIIALTNTNARLERIKTEFESIKKRELSNLKIKLNDNYNTKVMNLENEYQRRITIEKDKSDNERGRYCEEKNEFTATITKLKLEIKRLKKKYKEILLIADFDKIGCNLKDNILTLDNNSTIEVIEKTLKEESNIKEVWYISFHLTSKLKKEIQRNVKRNLNLLVKEVGISDVRSVN